MLPQVHLVSDIHKQISGYQSTTNIQLITLDINGIDSRIIFLVLLIEDRYINTPFMS